MKILLDIKDSKVKFFLEIIKNFSFVKNATTLTNAKADIMEDISESVKELKLVQQGKLTARNADDLIHEL